MPSSTAPTPSIFEGAHPSSPAPSPLPTNIPSLLTALDCRGHVHLILGHNPLAARRAAQSLAVGARPILIAAVALSSTLPYQLQEYIESGRVRWVQQPFALDNLFSLGRGEVEHVVDAVFVTSSSGASLSSSHISLSSVVQTCKRNRIPVNVVDVPAMCSFGLLSAFTDGPLQVGVTTNGAGCKLASRVRREVAAGLPTGLGSACARLGELRKRLREADQAGQQQPAPWYNEGVDDSVGQEAYFNQLVTPAAAEAEPVKARRMRWLAQVCEYWPLNRLTAISAADVEDLLSAYVAEGTPTNNNALDLLGDSLARANSRGRIILAGSGPGHPDLVTRATQRAIETADLVLADKLVPSGVLDLVPRRTPVVIARKFPGNSEAGQAEILNDALAAVRQGKVVVRLKQGDPFLYGRGGEEADFFRAHGLGDRVLVLPGLTSALSAPLFAAIPPTQRDVADQVLICTGTSKKGKPPPPPEYVAGRTAIFLMALHRIEALVKELTHYTDTELGQGDGTDGGGGGGSVKKPPHRALWPSDIACAVIERASCPDQRVIRTTLNIVVEAIEHEGSRPPGLLVVGRACEALKPLAPDRSWEVEDGFKGLDFGAFAFPAASTIDAELSSRSADGISGEMI